MDDITIFNSDEFGQIRTLCLDGKTYFVGKDVYMNQRVTVKQAASELQMGVLTVQCLMKEGRLPIGYAQKKEGCSRYSFYIYRHLLDEHKRYLGLDKHSH